MIKHTLSYINSNGVGYKNKFAERVGRLPPYIFAEIEQLKLEKKSKELI